MSLNVLAGRQVVEIRDLAGNVLTDTDEVRSGFQLELSKAETDFRIETTTEDLAETATYNLAVRWGFPARVTVADNHYAQAPNNPDLKHNIPDLEIVMDGQALQADFLSHFRRTGGLDRWGYPTSEVLVLEPNALTQFYQRGVVDFHRVGAGWITERRLAWDYVGGGLGGSTDLGVEAGVTNPHPGTPLGPWGHKVSNLAIDGTETGFAGFFERLGGVASFGFPKTDARRDTNQPGTLHVPDLTPGFVRQYFQSAVLEYHPNNAAAPVQLTLLGDTLRERLVPNWREQPGFAAAGPLANNQEYAAAVLWGPADIAIAPISRSDQLARAQLAFEKMLRAGHRPIRTARQVVRQRLRQPVLQMVRIPLRRNFRRFCARGLLRQRAPSLLVRQPGPLVRIAERLARRSRADSDRRIRLAARLDRSAAQDQARFGKRRSRPIRD